ncbi:MAG: right-handed parallel beta-helix repeat-containing protein [Acidimicrobiales bacterium]
MTVPSTVAGAAATGLWVSNKAPLTPAPGSSCGHPGYSTIQSAIDAAGSGATIYICGGNRSSGPYVEQLTITQPVELVGIGKPIVQLPDAAPMNEPGGPQNSTTTCDNAIGSVDVQPQDEVSICGAGEVSITGITVSAYWPASTCYDRLYGIFVGGGSDLVANKLTVDGAGVPLGDPDVGCQGGVAIQVGSAATSPNEVATASLSYTTVSNYQKNGITVEGADASVPTWSILNVTNSTVTGRGLVATAENGIQVSYGAVGIISESTVSDNECDSSLVPACGSNALYQTQATGVLFYLARGGFLGKSAIKGNDLGAYYVSGAATEPSQPEVTISNTNFRNNRYEGISLDQGVAFLSMNRIYGTGLVGIQVLQYSGQAYAPASTGVQEVIRGQGIGVQVLSDDCMTQPSPPGGPILNCTAPYTTPPPPPPGVTYDYPGTIKISGILRDNTVATQDNSPVPGDPNFTIDLG